MVYLPTFSNFFMVNVGKYTIHVGHDVEISLVQFRFSLFLQFVLNLLFCVISP